MKVRLLGFKLGVEGQALTLASFAAAVAAQPYDPDMASGDKRLFFINDTVHPDYHVGLVVTVKDQKTFCQLVQGNDSLLVKVNELAHGTKLMDFNFFVVHKLTGAGVYQYYHQSCSVSSFGHLAASRFRAYRESLIQSAIDNLQPNEVSEARRAKIRKSYKAQLKWEVIIRAEQLEELIKELKRVKSFEWCVATPTVEQDEFKPLAQHIKNKTSKLAFAVGAPVDALAKAVVALIGATPLARGRIEGEDEDGSARVLRIMNNPENFGEYEYDDLAGRIDDLNLTKFEHAWVVSEMIKSCKAHAHIFEVPMQP